MKLFDEENQDVEIKNQIARDLNWILSRVEHIEGQMMDDTDREFCAAAQRAVDRVAEFEEIEAISESATPNPNQAGPQIVNRMHPDSIAWQKWLTSDEGKKIAEGTTAGIYLENRLWVAFMAGRKSVERQPKKTRKP